MSDHYYSSLPQSKHKPAHVAFTYRGHALMFDTDSGVFSRLEIDKGTEILLRTLPEPVYGNVLDLGCGYGTIGVSIGKAYPECSIVMADINERAAKLADANAKRNGVAAHAFAGDGYEAVPKGSTFDFILQNPPIRAGKQVIYGMFADAVRYLSQEGTLWLVIRKQQGASSAVKYLATLFGTVQIMEKKGGYWILCCASPIAQREGETSNEI